MISDSDRQKKRFLPVAAAGRKISPVLTQTPPTTIDAAADSGPTKPADAADAGALALCHLAYDPQLRGPRTEGVVLR